MKCLKCGNKDFEERNTRLEVSVKGESVEVIVPAEVCSKCSASLMDDDQMNVLRRAAADEYRKKKGLLASKEIIAYRTALGMSQVEFAKHLNVGEASIKRWETYYVQDPVQNDNIRLKCDVMSARQNVLSVHGESQRPDIFSGHRPFSYELFEEVTLCLLPYTKSPLYVNKALYCVDFLHFREHGKSITGARYAALEYGPCPDQFQTLFEKMLQNGAIAKGEDHTLKGKREPNLGKFDDQEKKTIQTVIEMIRKKGRKHLFDASHKEKGYLQTPSFSQISYAHAKTLKVL